MQPRLFTLAAAFRGSAPWARNAQQVPKLRIVQFICRSCQRKFSTSPALRAAAKNVEKDRSEWLMKRVKRMKSEY